tara:strand:- start:304 stop:1086 length:783 start_codon:yes stop_codon:yes gene_type:complete
MGFFERFSRLLRANLNEIVSQAEDPVKILDQSLADMQDDLVKLRQAVAMAIASQKRLRSQADQAELQIKTWYERAELALRKGEEDLAREALTRRKTFQDSSISLTNQLEAQEGQVEKLKKCLQSLESKMTDVKTKKDMLKARAQAAQAQQQLENAVGNIGSNSAMAAFERMEDKVEALEASNQAAAELAGEDLESKFLAIEGGSDIEDEINELRETLITGIENVALPEAVKLDSIEEIEEVNVAEIDADLEELKDNIDKL